MNKTLSIILTTIVVLALGSVFAIIKLHDGNLGGVYTNLAPTSASTTVTTSATVVFSAAAGHTCRQIYNDSTSTVYCNLSNTVSSTLNTGIRLSSPTNASSGPTSVVFGCGEREFRAERITCIAGASAVVNTFQY